MNYKRLIATGILAVLLLYLAGRPANQRGDSPSGRVILAQTAERPGFRGIRQQR